MANVKRLFFSAVIFGLILFWCDWQHWKMLQLHFFITDVNSKFFSWFISWLAAWGLTTIVLKVTATYGCISTSQKKPLRSDISSGSYSNFLLNNTNTSHGMHTPIIVACLYFLNRVVCVAWLCHRCVVMKRL